MNRRRRRSVFIDIMEGEEILLFVCIIICLMALPMRVMTLKTDTEQWKKDCRDYGGQVVEDFRGIQYCKDPKKKIIYG